MGSSTQHRPSALAAPDFHMPPPSRHHFPGVRERLRTRRNEARGTIFFGRVFVSRGTEYRVVKQARQCVCGYQGPVGVLGPAWRRDDHKHDVMQHACSVGTIQLPCIQLMPSSLWVGILSLAVLCETRVCLPHAAPLLCIHIRSWPMSYQERARIPTYYVARSPLQMSSRRYPLGDLFTGPGHPVQSWLPPSHNHRLTCESSPAVRER